MTAAELQANWLLDVSSVEKLSSLTDISRLLHETLAQERGIEADLDHLLNRRAELEHTLVSLHADSTEVLSALEQDLDPRAHCLHNQSRRRRCKV